MESVFFLFYYLFAWFTSASTIRSRAYLCVLCFAKLSDLLSAQAPTRPEIASAGCFWTLLPLSQRCFSNSQIPTYIDNTKYTRDIEMNSGTNNTKWTSWTSLKKKPFPQMDDGESPEQPGLMPPGSPKSGGRLKRMLSNSKLSKFVQAPPNATLRDVDPEAKPRQRYNSFSRSFFGRSKPGFLPPSPPLSDTSTPDLSPSTSASSSSSSSFVSATLLQQSPYQRLELLPQITLDSNEPWALQSQQAISKEPRLEPALPIREPSQRQPGKTSPTKEKGRTKTNKSVWEISSESEGETESDVLHFQSQ